MQLQLQKCSLHHVEELMKISKKTFIDAFEEDNEPEDFKNYIDLAFDKERVLEELKNEHSYFYFVYKELDLVGYFKLNAEDAQSDVKDSSAMELERIYVLQEFQGLKIGQWMLDEVKEIVLEKGKKYIWLGVWEKNLSAIKFYQKYNFFKFGEHPYYIGKDKQTDWLMRYDV
ncbi:MAG: GNAT family N-acetyltransferase [Cellulophaga sp.]